MPRSFHEVTDRVALSGGGGTVSSLLAAFADPTGDIRPAMEARGWVFELDGTSGVSMAPPADDSKRVVLAGVDSGTPTPQMLGPDSFTANDLLTGLAFGVASGAFDWDASDFGFTADDTKGYYRALAPINSTHVSVAFNDHAIIIALDAGTNGTLKLAFLGGCGLPALPAFAESDGRLWGMSVSGGVATTGLAINMWSLPIASSATSNGLFSHGNSNGNAHTGVRNPDTGEWLTAAKTFTLSPSAADYLQKSDAIGYYSNPLKLSTGWLCEVEGVYVSQDELHRTRYTSPTSGEVICFANGFTSVLDAVAIEMQALGMPGA